MELTMNDTDKILVRWAIFEYQAPLQLQKVILFLTSFVFS
jgi:hypothetical protein